MNDLKSFELLVSVAQTGSFTATARQKGLTTAAVSKIVSRLEREVGVRFFSRTTRQVSLTSQGRIFVEKAALALEQFDHAMGLLHEGKNEPSGSVRVTTNAAFGKDLIVPLLPGFLDRFPKVDLEIRFHDGMLDLVKEGYDLGIQNQPQGEGTYVSRLLCQLPLALVASPAYLKRFGTPVIPQDLVHHQCVNVRLSSGQAARWKFVPLTAPGSAANQAAPGEHLHIPNGRVLVSEQYDAVVNAALAGLGLTVVFAQSVMRYLQTGELQVVLPDFEVEAGSLENNHVYIRYPHREYLPLATRAFIDFLLTHFKQQDSMSSGLYALPG